MLATPSNHRVVQCLPEPGFSPLTSIGVLLMGALLCTAPATAQPAPTVARVAPVGAQHHFCELEVPAGGAAALPRESLEQQCSDMAERRRLRRGCGLVSAATERLCSKVQAAAPTRPPLLFRGSLLARKDGLLLPMLPKDKRRFAAVTERTSVQVVMLVRPRSCADTDPGLTAEMSSLWLVARPVQGEPEYVPQCTATAVGPGVLLTAAHCMGAIQEALNVDHDAADFLPIRCEPHQSFAGSADCDFETLACVHDVAVCRSTDPAHPLDTQHVEALAVQTGAVTVPGPIHMVGLGPRSPIDAAGTLCAGTANVAALSAPENCPDPGRNVADVPPLDPKYAKCFASTTEGDRVGAAVTRGDSGGPVFDKLASGRRIVGVLAHAPEEFSTVSRFVQLSDTRICRFLADQGLVQATSCQGP